MKTLVLVHGRAQQKKDRAELKEVWLDALDQGLAKNNLELSIDRTGVRFPYYGDTLDAIVNPIEEAEVIQRGKPEDSEELRFKVALMDAMAKKAKLSDEQIREASGDPTIQRGPLNWGWVQGILSAFDRHVPGMSGTSVNLFTHDVFVYLTRPGARDEVDAVVRKEIEDRRPCVVVAHSLGTVVAFSVLNRDQALLGSIDLITVGSPLAVAVIQEAFRGHRMKKPACINSWFNAMDDRDVVALYALRPKRFPLKDIDNKEDVDNFTENRHGIEGYLSDPEVAGRIYRALRVSQEK